MNAVMHTHTCCRVARLLLCARRCVIGLLGQFGVRDSPHWLEIAIVTTKTQLKLFLINQPTVISH
jgi:hypothetical protein